MGLTVVGHAGRAHRSGIVRDQAPEPTGGTLRTAGNEAHGLSRLRVTTQTTAHTAATTASGSAGIVFATYRGGRKLRPVIPKRAFRVLASVWRAPAWRDGGK